MLSLNRTDYRGRKAAGRNRRHGVIAVLAVILLPVLCAFVAFGVDTGLMALTQTRLQNAADAAALAASQEISAAVDAAAKGLGDPTIDANSIAVTEAKAMAVKVAQANGVYLDAARDIAFGKRAYDDVAKQWNLQWNAAPYNVVKVVARRDNPNRSAPDAAVRLAFGSFVGKPTVSMRASASAFVEARDIVVVLDFSSSMNDDSQLLAVPKLGAVAVEKNLTDIYKALGSPSIGGLPTTAQYLRIKGVAPTSGTKPQIYVTFKCDSSGDYVYVESTKTITNCILSFRSGGTQKITGSALTGTFRGTGSNAGKAINKCWVKSGTNSSTEYGELFEDSNTVVKSAFALGATAFPFPRGSWDEYLDYCRVTTPNKNYRRRYGLYTLLDYVLERYEQYSLTPTLWKTPHYPFHSVKQGCSLFLNFLDELDFGDQVGLVSYATTARQEKTLNQDGISIDISSDPITDDYDAVNTIQTHKQAGHYNSTTGMGDGVEEARKMLATHMRYGARPTILLMTDGLANERPDDWAGLPDDWNWDELTDFDGDGQADYETTDPNKQYAFHRAKTAIDRGFTVHTLAVGSEADTQLMQAMAFAGKGINISVPGNTTIEQMQADVLEAFQKIAGKVPAPKLINTN